MQKIAMHCDTKQGQMYIETEALKKYQSFRK